MPVILTDFIHQTSWVDLPPDVQRQARRCLLDTLGAVAGGRLLPVSAIIYDFAATHYGGEVPLWLDGRQASPPGAALAHATTIDGLDVHDGYNLTKGHAGAALVPAVLATLGLGRAVVSGPELLTALVVGYEVALRAGVALHATAADYHTSGAWNALGCAAVTARRLGLTDAQTQHALGIAEYYGPRSPMMRCIDHPTMVKDGSGWGAMGGVSAGLLAADGFTGAPAETVISTEMAEVWADLGQRWRIVEQYFKPHAVCRWAQPAIEGALAVQRARRIDLAAVQRINVHTFHAAVRLATRRPQNTEEAQYSLPFPVAAALVHGRLGPQELSGAALSDPLTLRLAAAVELVEEPTYNERFPAERFARVRVELNDGTSYDSGEVQPGWDAEQPPTDDELQAKFRGLAATALPAERVHALAETVWKCHDLDDVQEIVDLLAAPIPKAL